MVQLFKGISALVGWWKGLAEQSCSGHGARKQSMKEELEREVHPSGPRPRIPPPDITFSYSTPRFNHLAKPLPMRIWGDIQR